jgi:hypothetical protein
LQNWILENEDFDEVAIMSNHKAIKGLIDDHNGTDVAVAASIILGQHLARRGDNTNQDTDGFQSFLTLPFRAMVDLTEEGPITVGAEAEGSVH